MADTVVCWISEIKRITNTASGNPRFRLYYGDGTHNYYATKPDGAVNYEIHSGMVGKRVRLTFDKGWVIDITEEPEQ